MSKRMLADVLWEAANLHLPSDDCWDLNVYSCNAALSAEFGKLPMKTVGNAREIVRDGSVTDRFLKRLGCSTLNQRGAFLAYREGPSRQGVRYLWLLLAMHVAADEGITV